MGESRLASVTVTSDVAVLRRDGVTLRADVYRPAGGAGLPTLVMRLPYGKSRAQSYWYQPPSWYAERGFAVVVEDVRGRYASEGEFTPLATEVTDGADLVRWVADQPWSNGRIGSYGYSYCGLIQLLLAGSAEDVPLQAIAPAMAIPRLGEGGTSQSGVPAWGFVLGWAAELGGLDLSRQELRELRDVVQRPVAQLRAAVVPGREGWVGPWLEQDPADPYWTAGLDTVAYEGLSAAVLHIGGWFDVFRRATVDHFAATVRAGTARSSQLVFGPWSHQPNLAAAVRPALAPDPQTWSVDDVQLRFFRRELMDDDLADPPVAVAVLNSRESWTGHSWPPPDAETVPFWLSSGGRANGREGDGELHPRPPASSPPDHLVYDHRAPVPAVGGDDCGDPAVVGMGPADQEQVERRRDVLVYTSAPVDGEELYLGSAAVELFVQTAAEHSQWLARLCLVTADGTSTNVAEAVSRLRAAPGDVSTVRLDLGDVAVRVGPGDRVRLHVTNGSSPRWAGLLDDASAVCRSVVLHEPAGASFLTLTRLR